VSPVAGGQHHAPVRGRELPSSAVGTSVRDHHADCNPALAFPD
jgi:hypothetical protein